ncbi:MAG: NYN domain-containing protein [Candidatus Pacebacteria bacterium]|nr:NYN domain-containing protein [Candidatus Paceibacterota bacterium]
MAVVKHKAQRVAVFIDTQNLYHSAKNLYHAKVNFNNVLEDAVASRHLIRAIAYVVNTEGGEEQNFFEALTKIGIETKTKDLQIFAGGAKKADWDIGMAIDAVKMASKLDAVILATGDGDFIPAVEHLKTAGGCQVEVISFGRSSSSKLRECADDFIDMDLDHKRYTIGGGASTPRQYAPRTTGPTSKRSISTPRKNAPKKDSGNSFGTATRLA